MIWTIVRRDISQNPFFVSVIRPKQSEIVILWLHRQHQKTKSTYFFSWNVRNKVNLHFYTNVNKKCWLQASLEIKSKSYLCKLDKQYSISEVIRSQFWTSDDVLKSRYILYHLHDHQFGAMIPILTFECHTCNTAPCRFEQPTSCMMSKYSTIRTVHTKCECEREWEVVNWQFLFYAYFNHNSNRVIWFA